MGSRNIVLAGSMLFLAGGIILVKGLYAAEPEAKMLLHPVDMSVTELKEKDAKILDRIKNDAATVGVKVCRLREGPLNKASEPLAVPLPGESNLELNRYKLTREKGATKLNWEKGSQRADLTLHGKSLYGLIYANDKVYSVEPINKDGLHAVIELNQSKLKDHPPAKDPNKRKDPK